jgi:homoserine O-acetyltransferase/O-succinyltransferase
MEAVASTFNLDGGVRIMSDYRVFDMGEVTLQCGVTLPDCILAYQTYGEPNASGDNVVLWGAAP